LIRGSCDRAKGSRGKPEDDTHGLSIDAESHTAFDDPANAIQREKNLKHWVRAWKIALIEKDNPEWHDLYDEICR